MSYLIKDRNISTKTMETFVDFSEDVRECEQWNFDSHCVENPDPRYTIDNDTLV